MVRHIHHFSLRCTRHQLVCCEAVKDDGEDVLFYGTSSPDGKTVEDLIIYMPSDGDLICLWGSIFTESLAGLADSIKE